MATTSFLCENDWNNYIGSKLFLGLPFVIHVLSTKLLGLGQAWCAFTLEVVSNLIKYITTKG